MNILTQQDAQLLLDIQYRIVMRRQEFAEQRDELKELDPIAFLENLLELSYNVFTAFNFTEYYYRHFPEAFVGTVDKCSEEFIRTN